MTWNFNGNVPTNVLQKLSRGDKDYRILNHRKGMEMFGPCGADAMPVGICDQGEGHQCIPGPPNIAGEEVLNNIRLWGQEKFD